ncbi:MAG: flagellar protein export ATPase FliI [Sphingobacteriia bacterium]|nr:flagellar protein export ATPase FliI [Sphingobacteriia bacterium]
MVDFTQLGSDINSIPNYKIYGLVTSVKGLLIEGEGLAGIAGIGARCLIEAHQNHKILCEVVGIENNKVKLIPYEDVQGIAAGNKIEFLSEQGNCFPHDSWLGRILNANAEPIDELGGIKFGNLAYNLKAHPPSSHKRRRVEGKLDLGIKSLNTFTTCCYGQRMGIFAGSGVGKSMLLAMITKYSKADVKVIGLIGERGRELKEFIEEYLGPEGLKNAVVIVATSDESPLLRKQAAFLSMSVAEYFRDQGKEVLLMMDSVTRFAMAQREIGLSCGEPPATKGYTPTVFSELPKLLERAGPGTSEQGNITGLFSVLVEGDDTNEPISDAVRGILDGHIILDREIAERGRFPAINVLKSISRTMPGCNTKEEYALVQKSRQIMATYNDMNEIIRIGAYKKGSDPEVDLSIKLQPLFEDFLRQSPGDAFNFEYCYTEVEKILANK